jgi:hypothetical protein
MECGQRPRGCGQCGQMARRLNEPSQTVTGQPRPVLPMCWSVVLVPEVGRCVVALVPSSRQGRGPVAAGVVPGEGLALALVWCDHPPQAPPQREGTPPPGQPRPVLPWSGLSSWSCWSCWCWRSGRCVVAMLPRSRQGAGRWSLVWHQAKALPRRAGICTARRGVHFTETNRA